MEEPIPNSVEEFALSEMARLNQRLAALQDEILVRRRLARETQRELVKLRRYLQPRLRQQSLWPRTAATRGCQ